MLTTNSGSTQDLRNLRWWMLFFKTIPICIKLSTRRFVESLMTNPKLDLQNVRWQIQYSGCFLFKINRFAPNLAYSSSWGSCVRFCFRFLKFKMVDTSLYYLEVTSRWPVRDSKSRICIHQLQNHIRDFFGRLFSFWPSNVLDSDMMVTNESRIWIQRSTNMLNPPIISM